MKKLVFIKVLFVKSRSWINKLDHVCPRKKDQYERKRATSNREDTVFIEIK